MPGSCRCLRRPAACGRTTSCCGHSCCAGDCVMQGQLCTAPAAGGKAAWHQLGIMSFLHYCPHLSAIDTADAATDMRKPNKWTLAAASGSVNAKPTAGLASPACCVML